MSSLNHLELQSTKLTEKFYKYNLQPHVFVIFILLSKETSMYTSLLDSDCHLPCLFKHLPHIPAFAAADAPPARSECNPKIKFGLILRNFDNKHSLALV